MLGIAACGGEATETSRSTPVAWARTQSPSPTPTAKGEIMKQYPEAPEILIDPNKQYVATIRTNRGDMTVKLFPREAPMSVNNFVFLSRDGYYDGVIFHRIIKNFMIQGGDPTGSGRGGPGYRFKDEVVTRDYLRGTLAMANAGPDTNGSQFFIIHQDFDLPKSYNIFGMITDGLDVLDTIATTAVTGAQGSSPVEPQVIETIIIHESEAE